MGIRPRRACRRLVLALAFGGALIAVDGSARAAGATLTAVADATLIEEPAGALANGSGINFFVGRIAESGGGTLRRALVRFDLTSVPAGSRITSATLQLSLVRSRFAGDLPVSIHRVTQSWAEGPSSSSQGIGDTSVAGDTTWIHRNKPAVLWTRPGGDYVEAASGSRIVGATGGAYAWPSTPLIVADVQGWLDSPASNHGWIVIGFEGVGTSAKGFAAREATTPLDRPTLAIAYDPPVPVDQDIPLPAWALAALGLLMAAAIRRQSGVKEKGR